MYEKAEMVIEIAVSHSSLLEGRLLSRKGGLGSEYPQ